jgi:hypothetical protein
MGHSDVKKPILGTERRNAIRIVYETVAMVAAYDGENFPPFSSFWEVHTYDLSATGIGFWSRRQPETELLLLMLGNPQAHPIFIVIRVAHASPGEVNDEPMFKVGCEMLRRLTTD